MAKSSNKTGGKQAGDYVQFLNVLGYVNNREITNLPGQFLVKGSQNVLIKNGEKVVTRPGYTLFGVAKTVNQGIHSSYDWNNISSGTARSLRQWGKNLEVAYNNAFISLKTMPTSNHMEFTTWWNKTELIDVLLFVDSTAKVYDWSGAITTVAGVTSNTITKQGYLSGNTISFSFNGTGLPGTIIKSDGGFNNAGFKAGDTIIVTGSNNNNTTLVIQSVTDTTIVVRPEYTLVNEVPLPTSTIIVQWPAGTWAGQRFFTANAGENNNRQVRINSVDYTYTGGETTGTLTGVTPDPTQAVIPITTGAVVAQSVRSYAPTTLQSMAINLISTMANLVFFGSTGSRVVNQSTKDDFTSFAWTNPLRIPGEGMTINLDSCPTAFIPGQQDAQMYISGGTDDLYEIQYKQSTSNNGSGVSYITELVTTKKIKTATGSAARSQSAVVFIKNAVTYLSFEPTIDTLGHAVNVVIESPQTRPISDPIRDDLEAYNLTGAHGIYFRRNLYYTLPAENRLIIHDDVNGYWQPPQIIPISRLAIITINGVQTLCGHSSVSNETYILNNGTNDNGSKFKAVAALGYESFGSRFEYKQFDEAAVELYLSSSTIVHDDIYYDYKGGTDYRTFLIDGKDQGIVSGPIQDASEGSAPEGTNPEGSSSDPIDMLQKARQISQTSVIDFFERQRVFWSDSIDAQFAILAYGENTMMSENQPVSIRK
jgi:hypothetical protein